MPHRPTSLLLPVEAINRELDGKLLLGLLAAERGMRAYVGWKLKLHAPGFPPSVYISKGVRFGNIFAMMEGFGHTIVAWDEEGLVRFPDDIYAARIDRRALQTPRLLFSWGPSNADLWTAHPHYNGAPVVASGNPRLDLVRPELRAFHAPLVARLRERYGPFVLMSSNFSYANHITGNKQIAAARAAPQGPVRRYGEGLVAHKRALLEHFLAAVPVLARALAPATLVIRPHHSEVGDVWHRAGEGLANVVVLHEGPIAPWLLAARALVHSSCTTAVEAAIAGTPAIAYRPIRSPDFDFDLPNRLSIEATSPAALAEQACLAVAGGLRPALADAAGRDFLARHASGLDGPLASSRIIAAIAGLELAPPSPLGAAARGLVARTVYGAKLAANTWFSNRARHERLKFPGLALADLEERIARFQGALGRFEAVTARQVQPDVFCLETR